MPTPHMIELSTNINELQSYLQDQKWLNKNESIHSIESPGEGNMNFTLRVNTEERSFILKQSRDYVEKYPQIDAPPERVLLEAEFYKTIHKVEQLQSKTPELLKIDRYNNVMMIEDLGSGSDYTYIYKKGQSVPENELIQIIDFASILHNNMHADSAQSTIRNRKMRLLNHEHMFVYPFLSEEESGLNLDGIYPGLKEVAKDYKNDNHLKSKVKEVGELYLKDGNVLLHGDYFPGSWLKTTHGIYIIDPEFCFYGPVEFDVGICIAHLKMADQDDLLIEHAIKRYQSTASLDESLRRKFTATEIIRRILGLAQLPLEIELEKRRELLEESRATLISN